MDEWIKGVVALKYPLLFNQSGEDFAKENKLEDWNSKPFDPSVCSRKAKQGSIDHRHHSVFPKD